MIYNMIYNLTNGGGVPFKYAWGIRNPGQNGFSINGLTFSPNFVLWQYLHENIDVFAQEDSAIGFYYSQTMPNPSIVQSAIKFGDQINQCVLVGYDNKRASSAWSGISFSSDGFTANDVDYGSGMGGGYAYVADGPRVFWFAANIPYE